MFEWTRDKIAVGSKTPETLLYKTCTSLLVAR